ncbi:hypothetical protein ACVXHB_09360, partial [Escherichia coli]
MPPECWKRRKSAGALPYPVGAESKYEIPPLFFIAFPERFAEAITIRTLCDSHYRIAAVKRRRCGFCVRVLPVFNTRIAP